MQRGRYSGRNGDRVTGLSSGQGSVAKDRALFPGEMEGWTLFWDSGASLNSGIVCKGLGLGRDNAVEV